MSIHLLLRLKSCTLQENSLNCYRIQLHVCQPTESSVNLTDHVTNKNIPVSLVYSIYMAKR